MMKKPLLLIDSYAQIYRGYYAVRALTNQKGVPSNAVFAISKFLMKLNRDYAGWDGAFVFDMGKPPHRMALAPEYKANRPPMPEDLRSQIEPIRALVKAFGWRMIEARDWEADDLIGCISKQFTDREIAIISADKDLAQLIDSRVTMLVPGMDAAKGFTKRGIAEVQEKFGVSPAQIVDYLAMIGDNADNIPGLDGVGPKTASALIAQFGSIESMIVHADEIKKEKLREKVKASTDLLRKNIQLVQLVTTPPESLCWTESTFHRNPPDFTAIRAIAEEYELRSVLKELNPSVAQEQTPSESSEPELFSAAPSVAVSPAVEEKKEKSGGESGTMTQPELF